MESNISSSILPEHDLARGLRAVDCSGTFEAHVTTQVQDIGERERFRRLCAEWGVKCVLIELPQGETRSQPMTASYHHGDLPKVIEEVTALGQRLRAAGFPIERLKLEAVATNEGLPESEEDVRRFPRENYFEFHIKLLLPADVDEEALQKLVEQHQARLSRNALKAHEDGMKERFVTLRLYHMGRIRAFETFERLVTVLSTAGYHVVHKIKEYTIYDSTVTLDAGWIDGPEPEQKRDR